MPRRIQSPSSINTYKQCPRKYYYLYIEKRKTLPSIHLIRGKVAHKVLEDFYDSNVTRLTRQTYKQELQRSIAELFVKCWHNAREELRTLNLGSDDLSGYFEETVVMLLNWFRVFCTRVDEHPASSFQTVFEDLKPVREQRLFSQKHYVQGYIDAIENNGDGPVILDYKTSKKAEITPEYRLQLGIYALLYYETYGVLPAKAGLFFLKHGACYLDVDAPLVQHASHEIAYVHKQTESSDMNDYPQVVSGLCKWSTGCCDFYDACFGHKAQVTREDIQCSKE